MGLFATTNLFSYTESTPTNSSDPFGLWDGAQAEAAMELGAMWYYYKEMKDKNFIGADKYYHCMAHCTASALGPNGAFVSLIVGYGREAIDFPKNMVKKSPKTHKGMTPSQSWKDCVEDLDANEWGRGGPPNQPCTERCKIFSPKSFLP